MSVHPKQMDGHPLGICIVCGGSFLKCDCHEPCSCNQVRSVEDAFMALASIPLNAEEAERIKMFLELHDAYEKLYFSVGDLWTAAIPLQMRKTNIKQDFEKARRIRERMQK